MIAITTDAITQAWTRNESDRLAITNGCWFDVSRGANAVWWIERYCKLYEGEWAGQNVLLRSACPEVDKQILEEWEDGGEQLSIARAATYAEWFADGNAVDWQYECTMRMFGWVRDSAQWGRVIRRFNAASIWIPKKQKKMNHPDTPVPTPDGWKRFGDLRAGDILFDSCGKQCKVMVEQLEMLDDDWYEIEFSNGEKIKCNGEHLWATETMIVPRGKFARGNNQHKATAVSRGKSYREGVWTTNEIRETLKTKSGSLSHRIQLHCGLQCDKTELPIDPYWLGLWLGDGTSSDATFTAIESDGIEYKQILKDRGCPFELRYMRNQKKQCRWYVDGGWTAKIRELGLFGNKHIPAEYLRSSIEDRISLLQGLMDTDGCVSRKYGGRQQQCIFSSKLMHLANQFGELLSSLGIKFKRSIEYREVGHGGSRGYHRIVFSPVAHLIPFRLLRKRDLYPKVAEKTRTRHIHIKSITKCEPVESRCITVDSEDGTYLVGRSMIPTHNSPTLAAWGNYLTCGDGEQGAKCFSGAKDGQQALISMLHAMAMIEQSPELSSECKINKNERSIEHIPTRSKYKPLSSANERTKTSKEGINGNILIDETHVVDRDFIKIISRAGISRAEPFHIEVSTAGNNPDGYGKERQDYARQVVCGAEQNDQLFVAIYEAPQTTTDKDLAADPIKYGKMANPAWGHTAHEEEYLADYNTSKRTLSGLADFKMYRLNIWQHTASQWLRLDQWLKCGDASLTIDDYKGRSAACGLDLSKTRDMSALSISLPVGDKVQLFVRLWMTEAYIEANADKAAFRDWVESGQLIQIPGDTIQEDFIRAEFERLTKHFDVRILVKDRAFAADFTDWCETKFPKILQVDYPQNAQMMEKPIDDFEAAVIEGSLIHENNLCLNWQAGHASVHENARGFRIIKKPKRDGYQKVDGMVAAVMSHWGTKHLPKRSSVYRRRGVLTA